MLYSSSSFCGSYDCRNARRSRNRLRLHQRCPTKHECVGGVVVFGPRLRQVLGAAFDVLQRGFEGQATAEPTRIGGSVRGRCDGGLRRSRRRYARIANGASSASDPDRRTSRCRRRCCGRRRRRSSRWGSSSRVRRAFRGRAHRWPFRRRPVHSARRDHRCRRRSCRPIRAGCSDLPNRVRTSTTTGAKCSVKPMSRNSRSTIAAISSSE